MSINIRFLSTRLATGSNQPGSTSETQRRIVKTHTIHIKPDSDSITQTISRALIKEILKN